MPSINNGAAGRAGPGGWSYLAGRSTAAAATQRAPRRAPAGPLGTTSAATPPATAIYRSVAQLETRRAVSVCSSGRSGGLGQQIASAERRNPTAVPAVF